MNGSEVMIANILGDRLLMTYATSVQVHARAGVILSLGAVCVRVIRVIFCPKISNVLLKVTVVSWWDYLVRLPLQSPMASTACVTLRARVRDRARLVLFEVISSMVLCSTSHLTDDGLTGLD